MRYLVVVLLVALVSLTQADDEVKFEEDENVLVLTDANFDQALAKYKNLLVEFYAPWCGHCKSLAPIYAETAGELKSKKSEVFLAKVDATENKELGDRFQISGFPTIRFFKDGRDTPMEYSSDRTKEAMLKYLDRKMEPAINDIPHIHHLRQLRKKADVIVLGFFKNLEGPGYNAFKNVAEAMDDHYFGHVTFDGLYKDLYVEEDQELIMVAKEFDGGRVEMTENFTEDNIEEFVVLNSLPRVIEFTQETAGRIFGQEFLKVHCLLFVSGDSKKSDAVVEAFSDVATDMRLKPGNEMLFVSVDTDVEAHSKIMEFFGVSNEELPTMRLVNLKDQNVDKFRPVFSAKNLDHFAVKTFIDGYYGGKLEKYYKSSELPADWDAKPVKELVQANFDQFIADNKDNSVFVMFYAPWCGHCKNMMPTWDELANTHKEGVVIAKVDGTANEIPRHETRGFPTIYYFPKGETESFQYTGERSMTDLEEYIKYDGNPPSKQAESKDEEEEEAEIEEKDEL